MSGVVKILCIPRGDRRYFNYHRPSSKTKELTQKKTKNKRHRIKIRKKDNRLIYDWIAVV